MHWIGYFDSLLCYFSVKYPARTSACETPPAGGGGTPSQGPHAHVPLDRAWFLIGFWPLSQKKYIISVWVCPTGYIISWESAKRVCPGRLIWFSRIISNTKAMTLTRTFERVAAAPPPPPATPRPGDVLGRFLSERVNRKWPFCITGQQFFPNFLAIRLNKSNDT